MKYLLLFLFMIPMLALLWGQDANYEESQVPAYVLPSIFSEGSLANRSVLDWEKRRAEILTYFEQEVYGVTPPMDFDISFFLKDSSVCMGGKGIRKQVQLVLSRADTSLAIDLLLYLPTGGKSPVPAFLGMNFHGNHTIQADPEIFLPSSWVPNKEAWGITDHIPLEEARGASQSRWPVEMILDRGYALAVLYCGDLDPDYDDGFQNGVHSLFPEMHEGDRRATAWGSIGAWAWGLSRAMDYLVEDTAIDGRRVAVIGHSRLGKTALWAGVQDERFAMVVSNNSGCGGATLFRRKFGETVRHINTRFPHWFCDNFNAYNDQEDQLPIDQHMLLALIAPRLLYVASATKDQWADPKGEYLATVEASRVYSTIYNRPGIEGAMPDSQFVRRGDKVAYHLREGKHDITAFDWENYLNFADLHWK
ncbi:MAG: acetylxylan esterase [Bacteroidota bacterium]